MVRGSNQPDMVHNPSSDTTGCLGEDGESNASNECLRRRSNFRPIRHLSGSDSHSPPIIYMGTELPGTFVCP